MIIAGGSSLSAEIGVAGGAVSTCVASLLPNLASIGVIVSPTAVTIFQNWAVSAEISAALDAAASTISVVSDGLDIRMPVSIAMPRRAPVIRSSTAVTTA